MRIFPYFFSFTVIISCKDSSTLNSLKKDIELNQEEIERVHHELNIKQKEINALKLQINEILSQESSKPNQLTELFLKIKPAVYLINTIDNDEQESQGSAFCISKDGIAVSNYHVFEHASTIYAFNGLGDKYLVTEILERNESLDYVIFRLGPLTEDVPYLKISNDFPLVGESVFTIGNPRGLRQTLSNGIISGHRDQYLLQTTTSITHGSSGGPLLNKVGEVIGITTSGFGEGNLNFAVDIHRLEIDKFISTPPSNDNQQLTNKKLENLLTNYYNHLKFSNLNIINNLYADTLSRYHGLYNISKQKAIKDHENYFSVYIIQDVNIIPSSITIYSTEKNHTLQYRLNYSIYNKKAKKTQNFILETVAVIDRKGKINSIYDNIVKKL